MATDGFSPSFYDLIRPGIQSSAKVLVPVLLDYLKRFKIAPKAMVDVGCGEGWWAVEFQNHGLAVVGVDGGHVSPAAELHTFVAADLEDRIEVGERFDLAVSLEAAEHLSAVRASTFVDDLCGLAPVVVFSAAVPEQGGMGHQNEQWPAYWAEHFHRNGFRVNGQLRYLIWDDDRIENWYRQNLFVACHPSVASALPDEMPLPLVHPVLWASRVPGAAR